MFHSRKIRFTLGLLAVLLAGMLLAGCGASGVKETEEITHGIDVARYQGTIDWEAVAGDGIDFAMVRVGYRANADGKIVADSNARYNLQEAAEYGVKLGAYFFSTAVSEEEAVEEANWVADFISQYPITYPVAYDCEGYRDPGSRQVSLAKTERTEIALAFLKQIEKRGYEGMFYSSKNEMHNNAQWRMQEIEEHYKVWVAQYPEAPYPATEESSYEGIYQIWQYTDQGAVKGIATDVDRNVALFGYDGIRAPKNPQAPEEAFPDVEAMMDFEPVDEIVTAKEKTNLRNMPSQGEEALVMYTLLNGERARRIAVSSNGWSKVEFNGEIYYALTSYLTTDMDYIPIQTQFTEVYEKVTAKEYVNLRNIPSTTHEKSVVVMQLHNGEIAIRTGINTDVGWSRIEYQGRILYCVSSHLKVVQE